MSSLSPQSAYTPYVQAIKSHNSTFARNGSDYVSYVFLRKEAKVQGVNTVKVWDCALQCYDQRLITTGGSAVEGQYVWMSFLPFEDKGHNAELDNFLQYDKKPDAFGALAWVDGQIFATAVNEVVAKSGPNGLTRAALLTAIRGIKNFDDNGFIAPSDIGAQDAEQVPDRHAGAERQVRARRPGRARQVRLHRPRRSTSPSTRSRPTRASQAVWIAAASPRPSSSTAVSRILNFWTLPVTVMGNSVVIFQ